MNILIVDDHPLVRKGLVSTLSFEDNIEKIQEASNVHDAMNSLIQDKYDSAIIDLNLGNEDGLEIIKRAKEKNLNTKFIILTSSIKKEDFSRAQKSGVDGYLLKDAFAEDIIYALSVIKRGRKFYDSEMLNYKVTDEEDNKINQLTPREKDVVRELGNGLSNLQIGKKLYISENTVKKHVSNILSKLNLSHRTQIMLLAKDIA